MIRVARLQRRLHYSTLAGNLGVSISLLCEIEHDRRRPSVELARGLARELGLDVDAVFCGAGHVPPDLHARLTSDPAICRTVRELLKSA